MLHAKRILCFLPSGSEEEEAWYVQELKKKASSQYARAQGSFVKQRKVLGSKVKQEKVSKGNMKPLETGCFFTFNVSF